MSVSPPIEPYVYAAEPRRFLFKEVEGVQGGGCHADVLLPAEGEKPAAGWPVAILIHGGAFIVGGTGEQPSAQVDFLLAHGVACVDVEYRLAPHANIVDMNADCLAAHAWVREVLNGWLADADGAGAGPAVDVDRIALAGYSAGGYLAAFLGVHATPRPRAQLLFYGLYDLECCSTTPKEAAWLGLSPQEAAFVRRTHEGPCLASADHERERPGPRRMWMTAALISDSLLSNLLPDDMPNTAANRRALSPSHLATAEYPPTFLAVPQLDTLVSPSQSFLFEQRLLKLGVDVASGRADMAPHAFDRKGDKENAEGGQWWEGVVLPGLRFLVDRLKA